ncbi:hypothetical protein EZS27_009740 [termite gut metagenome]|uniref:KilA-N DNA-binding domain-containing protein n=1 Tax=termite gut metagenome TaxID=433724 RepID=A0A5J4SB28_9ZZZZ
MLDYDLAELYQVETKRLKEQVRRNIERFPFDFMFELTREEYNSLRSQFATLEIGRGKYSKYLPFAFTEHGAFALSGVLNSSIAIEMNIQIVRAFVAMRQFALGYTELKQQLDSFMLETNLQFNEIYQALTELAEQKKAENAPRNPIGFKTV